MNDSNPFASRFIQPGAIEYLFDPDGDSASAIRGFADKYLRLTARRCAIVGPHGTGKSTLLLSLCRHLSDRLDIRSIRIVASGDGRTESGEMVRSLLATRSNWNCNTLVAVDGFEQLRSIDRFWLRRGIRAASARALITSHRDVRGYKTIFRTARTAEMDQAILARLLAGTNYSVEQICSSRPWQESLQQHPDNLRESLFAAFDAVASLRDIKR